MVSCTLEQFLDTPALYDRPRTYVSNFMSVIGTDQKSIDARAALAEDMKAFARKLMNQDGK